jgi:hypothetical protein
MAELGDFDLDRSGTSPPEPDSQGPHAAPWVIGLALIAILAGGYAWWSRRPQPVHRVAPPATAPAPSVAPPRAVAAESISLPPLGDTDALVRQLVGRLSSHPQVANWLATDQLIRNFTVVVTQISNGRTPTKHLQALRPRGRFVVAKDARGLYVDPASYRRYDEYADAISALDPEGTARVYETLKPRIQDAYRELGYPEGDFDSALKRAIVLLLETPVVEGRVGVEGTPPLYTFTDDRLELLAGVQRQLLRMGPRNERMVQAKLRAIAPLVGIAPQDLPSPPPM